MKKDYHTRYVLTCPLHSLAYEIECHERAGMSEQLVLPILKRLIPIGRKPLMCLFASDRSTSSLRGYTMCFQLS